MFHVGHVYVVGPKRTRFVGSQWHMWNKHLGQDDALAEGLDTAGVSQLLHITRTVRSNMSGESEFKWPKGQGY